MSAPRFLLKTDLARFEPVAFAGRPTTAQHEKLKSLLEARGRAAAAAVFAEPISGAGAISWYGVGSGDPQPLTSLSPERRAEAEQRLTQALAPIVGLLDDPEAGPLLRRALVVGAPEQIVVLDDAVVLAGWGTAPREVTGDEALARHASSVLGRYVPRLAGIGADFFGPVAAAAASPAAPTANGAQSAAPRPRVATTSAPIGAPAAAVAASGGPGWWLVPTLAGVAIAFLALGFWLAWTHLVSDMAGRKLSAGIVDVDRTKLAIKMQQETNEALEKEIERAKRAAQAPDVCRAEGPITGQSLPPLPQSQPVPQAQVPPAVPTQPGQTPAPVSSLANLLEHATVMIVTAGPKGIGHGSGFFISGDMIATNAHVVEHADPQQIFVMSKSIGRAVKAERVTMTSQPGSESEPGKPDFALLKLPEQIAGAQPLAITTTVEKLTDVVAAGYPASVVRVEAGMASLREGRLGEPPELVLTRGTISTVQRLPTGLTVMPHSADISPGNSGGPLVDLCGRVVGINTFVSRATEVADRVRYAQKSDDLVGWLSGKATPQMREGACQPEAPQSRPGPSATPGGPSAPQTPSPAQTPAPGTPTPGTPTPGTPAPGPAPGAPAPAPAPAPGGAPSNAPAPTLTPAPTPSR